MNFAQSIWLSRCCARLVKAKQCGLIIRLDLGPFSSTYLRLWLQSVFLNSAVRAISSSVEEMKVGGFLTLVLQTGDCKMKQSKEGLWFKRDCLLLPLTFNGLLLSKRLLHWYSFGFLFRSELGGDTQAGSLLDVLQLLDPVWGLTLAFSTVALHSNRSNSPVLLPSSFPFHPSMNCLMEPREAVDIPPLVHMTAC